MHLTTQSTWAFRLEQAAEHNGTYLGGLMVCEDPSCPCETVTVGCQQADPGLGQSIGKPFLFQIDLEKRKLQADPRTNTDQASLRFARHFIRELDEEGWKRLRSMFLDAKRGLSEKLDAEKVKIRFPVKEIEEDGVMIPYMGILPFDEEVTFTHDSREYLAVDYHCLNSQCHCKNVQLVFHALHGARKSAAPVVGSISCDYGSRKSSVDKGYTGKREIVESLFSAVRTARPDLFPLLQKRHKTLRLLYRNFLKKSSPQALPVKAGRNDPCPCGSGKKFKHCCGL